MDATLLPLLRPDAVPMEALRQRYGGLLEMVRTMIGVVPNCVPYLEIWPVAFRTYNVLVPNFLNLPLLLWGVGAPRQIIGLAMYSASRVAGCAYCSAHSCSFALRRGAPPAVVAGALDGGADPRQRAAIAVARAMSQIPAAVTDDARADLTARFSSATVEWIVLAIAMMGFLNKFMDAVGVELESEPAGIAQAVIAPTGWRPGKHFDGTPFNTPTPGGDSFRVRLGVLRHAPLAMSLDGELTAGVPSRWPAVGEFLRAKTGHDFPILSKLTHRRAIRAIAAIVRDNFDAANSVIGLPLKRRLGSVYADVAGNVTLAREVEKLARGPSPFADDARTRAALLLGRAASTSPAQIDANVVEACRESRLGAAAVIEIVVWLSVLQMLHRLSAFYRE